MELIQFWIIIVIKLDIMKKIILILLFPGLLFSQEYDFLNNHEKNQIFLRDYFEPIDDKYLSQDFFEENWSLISNSETPDINIFLKNFNFQHAKAVVTDKNRMINFKKLNNNYIKVDNFNEHLKKHKYYTVFSKPIFNCGMDWVIIYKFVVYSRDIGNTGDIYIYRNIGDKWIYFHKVSLWIS